MHYWPFALGFILLVFMLIGDFFWFLAESKKDYGDCDGLDTTRR